MTEQLLSAFGHKMFIINPYRYAAGGKNWLSPYALWDISVTSSLWQDSAGTTAAGVGDTVQRVDDQSGNGHNLLFAAGKEPTVAQEGTGELYLSFSAAAADAGSAAIDMSAGGEATVVCGVSLTSLSGTQIVYEYTANYNGPTAFIGFFGGTTPVLNLHQPVQYSGYKLTATANGNKHVFSHVMDTYGTTRDTESIHIRNNGASDKVSIDGTYHDADSNFANDTLYVGGRAGTSLYANMKFYGLALYNTALSLTDLQTVESTMSENVPGVSL